MARSLMSKGFLGLIFNWQHYYYTLNNDGIQFLKTELGIEDESVLPVTHKERADFEDKRKKGGNNKRDQTKEQKPEEIQPKAEVEIVA